MNGPKTTLVPYLAVLFTALTTTRVKVHPRRGPRSLSKLGPNQQLLLQYPSGRNR